MADCSDFFDAIKRHVQSECALTDTQRNMLDIALYKVQTEFRADFIYIALDNDSRATRNQLIKKEYQALLRDLASKHGLTSNTVSKVVREKNKKLSNK